MSLAPCLPSSLLGLAPGEARAGLAATSSVALRGQRVSTPVSACPRRGHGSVARTRARLAGAEPSAPAEAAALAPPPEPESASGVLQLACPICHRRLVDPGATSYSMSVASRMRYKCQSCQRKYTSNEGFVDAVIDSGATDYLAPDLGWGGSSTFQNPLVSFVYERGWRQNFQGAGFPGPDEEWSMARDALRGAEGQTVLDVSCGSGLFTRRMAASGLYPLVVAVDYSETMLRQTKEFIQADRSLTLDRIALVRADVARLPFESGSVAGVHAGAALHCWPSPANAVAEISRVLKPGGVFAATTFLSPTLPLGDDLIKPFRKAAMSRTKVFKYWEPEELVELYKMCGLVNYTSERRGNFLFLYASRPE